MSTMRTETNIMNIMNTTSTNSSVLTIPRAIFDQRNSDRSYERRQIDATGLPYRRPQNDPNALHQKYHPPPPLLNLAVMHATSVQTNYAHCSCSRLFAANLFATATAAAIAARTSTSSA